MAAKRLEVEYILKIEPENISIEGNCSAIDPETDRKQEAWIRSQLASGNGFAWCWASVTAKAGGFEGADSLGGISCRNREEFERVFLPDLKANALEDLRSRLRDTILNAEREARKRADIARLTLARLPRKVG